MTNLALRTRLVLLVLTLGLALSAGLTVSFWALNTQADGVEALQDVWDQAYWSRQVRDQLEVAQILVASDSPKASQQLNFSILVATNPGWENRAVDGLQKRFTPMLQDIATQVAAMNTVDGPSKADVLEAIARLDGLLEDDLLNAESGARHGRKRWEAQKAYAYNGLVTVTSVTLIVMTLATWSQFVSIRSSFRRLNARVQRIASGRINERLPVVRGDKEMAELSNNINQVAERLHGLLISLEERVRGQSTALARAERLASVGFLAAGVAHEINNPLAVIAGEAELFDTSKLSPDAKEAVAVIRDEAFRCKAIIKRLLKLSTPGGAEAEAVDCRAVSAEVLRNARSLARERGCKLIGQVPEGLTVYADGIEIKQVLLNLVVNAIEADAAVVRIVGVLDAERIGMAVLDDGRGLEPEQLLKVFEPFYTSKTGSPGTGGTGLGLALAYAIIEQSGGLLEAFSDGPFKGCRFVMSWPKDDAGLPVVGDTAPVSDQDVPKAAWPEAAVLNPDAALANAKAANPNDPAKQTDDANKEQTVFGTEVDIEAQMAKELAETGEFDQDIDIPTDASWQNLIADAAESASEAPAAPGADSGEASENVDQAAEQRAKRPGKNWLKRKKK